MSPIQVDMFEVQLGASMLLTFKAENQIVRILADGGIHASGYNHGHVHQKLEHMLGSKRRIDLMIGTHYDQDHLNGLVPIIQDKRITIVEAWMPPVANDTIDFAIDSALSASDLLTQQLYGEDGADVLRAYLDQKRRDIDVFKMVERGLTEEDFDPDEYPYHSAPREADGESIDVAFFRSHLREPDGHCATHGHNIAADVHPSVARMLGYVGDPDYWGYLDDSPSLGILLKRAAHMRMDNPERASGVARSMTNLRDAAAKQAINASALFRVLNALRLRKIPMRTEIITNGIPRRYAWVHRSRRFVPAPRTSPGLSFELLGPSQALVVKHRNRAPRSQVIAAAFAFRGEIKSITPSNQLSYIGCFRHLGQAILVSGDAGCVDFKQGDETYFPQLIAALNPLHVVQVAHHGGYNAHFYRVLAQADYSNHGGPTYLMLSHATHDATRPTDVFREFFLTNQRAGHDVRLLFTSEPTKDKVQDYLDAICPAVDEPRKVGDIRLSYDGEWHVKAHSIAVA